MTVTWNVDAHTHLAKMGSDVSPPRGSFTGTIDLATGNLTGNLALPPATITMYALGTVAAADASFAIDPVGPTTGHVDFASSHVTTTSTFNIRLAKITPHPIPAGVPVAQSLTQNANLVGSNCRTSTPISVTMSGTVDFVHGGTFSGNFSIPKFRDCKAMTAAINAIIPGDGNTFAATFSPPGTPAPAPAPGPAPAAFGTAGRRRGPAVGTGRTRPARERGRHRTPPDRRGARRRDHGRDPAAPGRFRRRRPAARQAAQPQRRPPRPPLRYGLSRARLVPGGQSGGTT